MPTSLGLRRADDPPPFTNFLFLWESEEVSILRSLLLIDLDNVLHLGPISEDTMALDMWGVPLAATRGLHRQRGGN